MYGKNIKLAYFSMGLVILLFCFQTPAQAQQQFTLTLTQYGTWAQDNFPGGDPGYADGAKDYLYTYSGGVDAVTDYANYFILDLTNIPANDVITSVTYQSEYIPYESPNAHSYSLLTTHSAPSALESSGTGMAAVYDSLVDGTVLAQGFTQYLGPTEAYQPLTLTGDSAFLSLLNSNIGNVIAIAGGDSDTSDQTNPVFTVTTVPEPSEVGLFAAAALGLLVYQRRRRVVLPLVGRWWEA